VADIQLCREPSPEAGDGSEPPQFQLRVKHESASAALVGDMSVPPLALSAAACYTEIRGNALVSCGWGDR